MSNKDSSHTSEPSKYSTREFRLTHSDRHNNVAKYRFRREEVLK